MQICALIFCPLLAFLPFSGSESLSACRFPNLALKFGILKRGSKQERHVFNIVLPVS